MEIRGEIKNVFRTESRVERKKGVAAGSGREKAGWAWWERCYRTMKSSIDIII